MSAARDDGLGRFRLDGKVAVVTGASRGIGRALAVGLAGAGASVVAAARDLAACEAVAAEIEAGGGHAAALRLDLADAGSHADFVAGVLDRFGALDVLVNNAGTLKPHFTEKVTPAELDALLDVNLRGPVFLSVAALDALSAGDGGVIVNVGALAAFHPMEGIGAYGAVKAAMANWSVTMAREWASRNVRVHVLVPGSVATDMILPRDPDQRARFVEEYGARPLIGRLGEPDDLVGAAIFLASPASAYMTGRPVFVDGGLLG